MSFKRLLRGLNAAARRMLRDIFISILGILLVLVCLAILAALVLFAKSRDPVIASLGRYRARSFYTSGGFQDFTDYAKYKYRTLDAKKLEDNAYFQPVSEDNMDTLLSYVYDFEGWVEVLAGSDLAAHYDFQKDWIDTKDYFCLQSKEGEPLGNSTFGKFDTYNLYFVDLPENMLYYFHNNI